jgi:hypothetical protein
MWKQNCCISYVPNYITQHVWERQKIWISIYKCLTHNLLELKIQHKNVCNVNVEGYITLIFLYATRSNKFIEKPDVKELTLH